MTYEPEIKMMLQKMIQSCPQWHLMVGTKKFKQVVADAGITMEEFKSIDEKNVGSGDCAYNKLWTAWREAQKVYIKIEETKKELETLCNQLNDII